MMMASAHHTNRHTTDLYALWYIITQSKDREKGKGCITDEITTSLRFSLLLREEDTAEREREKERKEKKERKNKIFFLFIFLLSK